MRRSEKLPKEEVQKMFYKLSQSIAGIDNVTDASALLQDLLSFAEAEMIAKRLTIAGELINGKKYHEIREKYNVSPSTIARVNEWLERSGEGYRKALHDIKDIDIEQELDKKPTYTTSEIKRRYPMYYWPEILLETIVNGATKKQQAEIKRVMRNMEKSKQKSDLFHKLQKIMK